MFNQALKGYEKTLGLGQANSCIPALNTIQNLAALCVQAKTLYQRCIAGIQSVLGAKHDRYQQSAQELARLEQD